MDIRTYLKDNLLLMDGAMGTYYAKKTDNYVGACELANLSDSGTVKKIHQEYLEAGCGALKTNTFMANRRALDCDEKRAAQIIEAGWDIARDAAEQYNAFVFADIGPVPDDGGPDTFALYQHSADVFLSLGAKYFLLETFGAPDHLEALCDYIKSRDQDAFILVSFAVLPEGYTRQGYFGASLYRQFDRLPATDAVGFNCVCGPNHMHKLKESLPPGTKPFSAMPNAGYPTVVNNRTYYAEDAGYFAKEMCKIAQAGARILGGCCGTTPALLKRVHQEVLENKEACAAGEKTERPKEKKLYAAVKGAESGRWDEKNRLSQRLERGERVIAVELDPPTDGDGAFFMEGARRLRDLGANAVTIADCPVSRARTDSSILACKLRRELGIDPVPHMTCRDRNINATKALLLGLHMEGVRNVLAVTGDPVPALDRGEVKGVYNFNSPRLAGFIRDLGEQLGDPFYICGALNVNAVNFDAQIAHARNKIANGVKVFLTQPVFCAAACENLRRAHEELPAKILGGILPIVSYRNACYMNNEIAGITIGEETVELYNGLDKEQAGRLAVEIALRTAGEIAPYVDGYYLITPFKRVDLIEQIIEGL